jgi:fatty acid desaturase
VTDYRTREPEDDIFARPGQQQASRLQRRRAKIAAELERNRQGEHRIPTWVMVVAIGVIIAAFAAVTIFG